MKENKQTNKKPESRKKGIWNKIKLISKGPTNENIMPLKL